MMRSTANSIRSSAFSTIAASVVPMPSSTMSGRSSTVYVATYPPYPVSSCWPSCPSCCCCELNNVSKIGSLAGGLFGGVGGVLGAMMFSSGAVGVSVAIGAGVLVARESSQSCCPNARNGSAGK